MHGSTALWTQLRHHDVVSVTKDFERLTTVAVIVAPGTDGRRPWDTSVDELLSYVVFEGDFLRWFVDRVRAGDDEAAQRFVDAVEPLMTTDVRPEAGDRVWNLAAVCFVEGLVMEGSWDDVIDRSRGWMGLNTTRDVDRMYRNRSGDVPLP